MIKLKYLISAVWAMALVLSLAHGEVHAQRLEQVDLIISRGTVVTMDADRRVIESGAVAVSDGKIVAVGTSAEIAAKYRGKETIDARGRAVIPGLINTHTHIPMTLFRG